jgi:hypothetical protein
LRGFWLTYFRHTLSGYTGKTCQEETDPCASSPCQNAGTCARNGTQFRCDCGPGFGGPLCQHNLNECVSSPCVHGICVDQQDGYRCFCQPGKSLAATSCVPVSEFGRDVDQTCAFLGCYAASSGNLYRRFRTTYRPHIQGSRSPMKQDRKPASLDFLTLADGTDTLSRNVSKGLPFDAA